MARFTDTQVIEVFAGDDDEICWEIEFEVEFNITGGCAPWKGSIYSCPSDVDWYGDPGDVEVESVSIVSVVDHSGDEPEDVELDAWEEAIVLEHAEENIDDDALYEAAGDQAADDFDPPDPEPYDYDDYRY